MNREPKADEGGGDDPNNPEDSYHQMIAALGEQGFANQWAILDVTNWLHEQPGHEAAGHVGGASDHRTRTMTLWWHDPESRAAAALLRRTRAEARRRNVTLKITPVPWTQAMIREARTVIHGPHGRALLGFEPTGGAGPQPPANVLLITGDLPNATPDEMASLARRAQAVLQLPIPVVVRHQKPSKGPWG